MVTSRMTTSTKAGTPCDSVFRAFVNMVCTNVLFFFQRGCRNTNPKKRRLEARKKNGEGHKHNVTTLLKREGKNTGEQHQKVELTTAAGSHKRSSFRLKGTRSLKRKTADQRTNKGEANGAKMQLKGKTGKNSESEHPSLIVALQSHLGKTACGQWVRFFFLRIFFPRSVHDKNEQTTKRTRRRTNTNKQRKSSFEGNDCVSLFSAPVRFMRHNSNNQTRTESTHQEHEGVKRGHGYITNRTTEPRKRVKSSGHAHDQLQKHTNPAESEKQMTSTRGHTHTYAQRTIGRSTYKVEQQGARASKHQTKLRGERLEPLL